MLLQILTALLYASFANGQRELHTTSFGTCMDNSQITASVFRVSIFANRTLTLFINGTSTFRGNDTIGLGWYESRKSKYGITFDPCTVEDFPNFCPLDAGALNVNVSRTLPGDSLPEDIFTKSMLEAEFRFYINNSTTMNNVGCLRAVLANGVNRTDMANTNSSSANTTDDIGDEDGGSPGGISYFNWTLLASAMAIVAISNSM